MTAFDVARESLAISNLIFAYEIAMDTADFEEAARIMRKARLTREGHPGETRGGDLVETYRARLKLHDGRPRTRHVVTNLLFDFADDGAHATVRSYFTVFQQVPDALMLQAVSGGTYRDEFEARDGTWSFVSRHAAVDFVGDTSQLYR